MAGSEKQVQGHGLKVNLQPRRPVSCLFFAHRKYSRNRALNYLWKNVLFVERLKNEILRRSLKLKIPSEICKEIIENNDEINELQKAIYELENLTSKH